MEGRDFSHYHILQRLGGGGMGAVYKALDTRLQRHVALKFLPPEMTRDDEARQRFIQEAQAASALDHPNICTVHEIDATPEGQMFIAMAYYDGATLKKLIEEGPLPVERAVDIGRQIARGLAKAHAAGIVHRDIKPANVMVTSDGFVKVVDFGIAKLMGVTGPTREGSTVGTVAYMAPEQVAGQDAVPGSDVWAVGVVLYEMLTGRVPFPGQSPWSVMNSIANQPAEDPRTVRQDIPDAVASVVMRALEKPLDRRFGSAAELAVALEASARTDPDPAALRKDVSPLRRPRGAVPLAAAVVALAIWSGIALRHRTAETRAHEESIPRLLALLDQDDYVSALVLAEEIERVIPSDPILADAIGRAAVTGSIVTEPAGATVYLRRYGASDDEWRPLGQSPIEGLRLPRRDPVELRIEKDGYEPVHAASGVPGLYFGRGANTLPVTLSATGTIPAEMVYIPGGNYPVRITGFNSAAPMSLDPFLMDRYEVTNAEYAEFVEAGGYRDPGYWKGLEFRKGDPVLTWAEAIAEFLDSTGQPGPSTWEFGHYPEGRGDYPVGGVSWYEAAAYLAFRGKSLPTIFHWSRAALEPQANAQPLAAVLIPAANFGGQGPVPVGSSGSMASHGTFDTAGNVKEWAWNASGDQRWILGGAWDDDSRMYSVRFTSPPFDRSPQNGFRGVRYLGDPPSAELRAPVDLNPRDYRGATAVPDDVYGVYRRLLAYVPDKLEARVEETDDSRPDWTREYVSLDPGTEDGRFGVVLLLPKEIEPPYPTLIYFPGIGPFQTRPTRPAREVLTGATYDYILKSGRAIVVPVWAGSFERWDDFLSLPGDQYLRAMGARVGDWAADLGRTIDYLETRDDIEADRIGYFGVSFGASTSLALLALEPRLKAALLYLSGFTYRDMPPEADAVNYAPRVKIPVLMIGGRYDYVFPVETAQRPLYEQLGTPEDDKQLLLYEMGHGPFPRGQTMRDVLPWLDRYFPRGD